MDGKIFFSLLCLVLIPVIISAWVRDERRETRLNDNHSPRRPQVHFHTKRHMLPEPEPKRRFTTPRSRDMRKKPSGHLTPLEEDDIDNDEVVSVAIGPPPIRPKYAKMEWKHPSKLVTHNESNTTATNIVKDVFVELGRELLARQVSEDFIFGQYIGNAMKNLSAETKLSMQHEVLELILKYQKINRGDVVKSDEKEEKPSHSISLKVESKKSSNDTEDAWPDFSNLAKIVG